MKKLFVLYFCACTIAATAQPGTNVRVMPIPKELQLDEKLITTFVSPQVQLKQLENVNVTGKALTNATLTQSNTINTCTATGNVGCTGFNIAMANHFKIQLNPAGFILLYLTNLEKGYYAFEANVEVKSGLPLKIVADYNSTQTINPTNGKVFFIIDLTGVPVVIQPFLLAPVSVRISNNLDTEGFTFINARMSKLNL